MELAKVRIIILSNFDLLFLFTTHKQERVCLDCKIPPVYCYAVLKAN